MKKKPELSSQAKVTLVLAAIVLAPIWVPLLIYMLIYAVAKQFFVYGPAINKIQMQPRKWLTWKRIKLITGLSTNDTIGLLRIYTDDEFLECCLREAEQVERLRKFSRFRRVPTGNQPWFPEQIIFYKFRMVWKGGRTRPSLRSLLEQMVGQFQPKPVFQPAYA